MSEDLNEKDVNVNEIDPFQEILDYDFSTTGEFDIVAKAKLIEDYKVERLNVKNNEAENIIEEVGNVYLNEDQKNNLVQIKTNFESLIKKYDLVETKDYTSEQRDAIYGIAQFIKNSYIDKINNLIFTIKFTREEYQILNSFLRNKNEYDGVEIFNILELKTRYLDEWDEMFRKLPKTEKEFVVEIDIKNIVMLYHFISKCKVKGFDNQFNAFISILTKIGDTNKIYNAYNVIKERVNTQFLEWTDIINVELKTKEESDLQEQQYKESAE
jgi:hypothetical protein